jgi:hypothetical protein
MATWQQIAEQEPEFAARVQALFAVHKHKVIATLRSDGSPRISGIEAEFVDGQVRVGMMPGSLKSSDVLRDPRVALHGPMVDADPEDPSSWAGDVKLSGRAVPVDKPVDATQEGSYFHLDIDEVSHVKVGRPADHLVIESWHTGRGLQRRTRL